MQEVVAGSYSLQCGVKNLEKPETKQTLQPDSGHKALRQLSDDGRTLFIVTNEWAGAKAVNESARNSQIVSIQVSSAHVGGRNK